MFLSAVPSFPGPNRDPRSSTPRSRAWSTPTSRCGPGSRTPRPSPAPNRARRFPRRATHDARGARPTPFHVQTISAARCLSEDDARRKIIAAATHGAAALLLVSGDAPTTTPTPRAALDSSPSPRIPLSSLDSLALLSVASARVPRAISPETILGCVANPSFEGADGALSSRRRFRRARRCA